MSACALFAAKRVFQTTDGVADLAGRLVGLAFVFELGVPCDLAGHFLDGALGLLCRTLDPILIHFLAPS